MLWCLLDWQIDGFPTRIDELYDYNERRSSFPPTCRRGCGGSPDLRGGVVSVNDKLCIYDHRLVPSTLVEDISPLSLTDFSVNLIHEPRSMATGPNTGSSI